MTLDAGALIAFERGDAKMRQLLREVLQAGARVIVPAGVLAKVWRDGSRQVDLRVLLRASNVQVDALTAVLAMAVGELLARRHATDVIDASVVLAARRSGATVVTDDPDDIRSLDPSLRIRPI